MYRNLAKEFCRRVSSPTRWRSVANVASSTAGAVASGTSTTSSSTVNILSLSAPGKKRNLYGSGAAAAAAVVEKSGGGVATAAPLSPQQQQVRSVAMAKLAAEPFMTGTSSVYIEEMYQSWLEDPSSVHKVRNFFILKFCMFTVIR